MQITIEAISKKDRGPWGAKVGGEWMNFWGSGKNAVALEKGKTYEVVTEAKEFNGKSQTWVVSAKPASTAPAVAASGARPGNGTASYTTGANDRSIFVTGIVGRAMGSGEFGTSDIRELALAADEAFDAVEARRAGRFPPRANGSEPPPPNGEDDYR